MIACDEPIGCAGKSPVPPATDISIDGASYFHCGRHQASGHDGDNDIVQRTSLLPMPGTGDWCKPNAAIQAPAR